MAVLKLSQIATAPSPPALTDTVIGVSGTTTDYQYTLAQLQLAVGAPISAKSNLTFTVDNVHGVAPFDTLQHAWDYVSATYYLGPHSLTFNLAASATTYTLIAVNPIVGGSQINIYGAGSATTTITDISFGAPAFAVNSAALQIDKVTLADDGLGPNNSTLFANGVWDIGIGNDFGDVVTDTTANTASFGLGPTNGCALYVGAVTVKGNAPFFCGSYGSGCLVEIFGPITFTNNTFATAIFSAQSGSCLHWFGTSTGSVTGKKWIVNENSFILNGTANPLPGTIIGSRYLGGVYEGPDTNNLVVATTGSTVTMHDTVVILTPAGTLAALTVNLFALPGTAPNQLGLLNGVVVNVSTTKAITALTVATTDGSSVVGAPTTLPAGGGFAMVYDAPTNTWYPYEAGSGLVAGGVTTQVQFNNSGVLAGNADLLFNTSNQVLAAGWVNPIDGFEIYSDIADAFSRTVAARNFNLAVTGSGNDGITWGNTATIGWTAVLPGSGSDAANAGTRDTGITRKSAGVVEITDGSSGYGAIDASAYSVSGTAGISATITTAKVTPVTGANGSMTFVNGILTAQTQAT